MNQSQRFLARNRPPRVQIEYALETYGQEKMTQIPFIVGVMADLAGESTSPEAKKALAERSFGKVDAQNFDERMKKLKPRITFEVRNTLMAGEAGAADSPPPKPISVALEFENMADFTPVRVAERVPGLKELVDLRRQLESLKNEIDGKSRVQEILSDLLDGRDNSADTLKKLVEALPRPVAPAEAAEAAAAPDAAA